MSKKVRITVAEPSVMLREGVLSVLRRTNALHLEVSEVDDLAQLKCSIVRQKPDILIINPAFLGLFSLQQLRKEAGNPELKCVALQLSVTDAASLKAYDEVISIYDSPEQINDKIVKLVSQPEGDKRHESLSQREKEVIVCVIQGLSNKQIADKLNLSAHTVITHRRNIASKLDIHSTAGLTIYAIVNKLVDLDDIKDSAAEG